MDQRELDGSCRHVPLLWFAGDWGRRGWGGEGRGEMKHHTSLTLSDLSLQVIHFLPLEPETPGFSMELSICTCCRVPGVKPPLTPGTLESPLVQGHSLPWFPSPVHLLSRLSAVHT